MRFGNSVQHVGCGRVPPTCALQSLQWARWIPSPGPLRQLLQQQAYPCEMFSFFLQFSTWRTV